MPSAFKTARFEDEEDNAEFTGFTLAVLVTASIRGDIPSTFTFVALIAVTSKSLPSKAISLARTLTVTDSPCVTVALSIDGKILAPTPVAALNSGREADAEVSKAVKFEPE